MWQKWMLKRRCPLPNTVMGKYRLLYCCLWDNSTDRKLIAHLTLLTCSYCFHRWCFAYCCGQPKFILLWIVLSYVRSLESDTDWFVCQKWYCCPASHMVCAARDLMWTHTWQKWVDWYTAWPPKCHWNARAGGVECKRRVVWFNSSVQQG